MNHKRYRPDYETRFRPRAPTFRPTHTRPLARTEPPNPPEIADFVIGRPFTIKTLRQAFPIARPTISRNLSRQFCAHCLINQVSKRILRHFFLPPMTGITTHPPRPSRYRPGHFVVRGVLTLWCAVGRFGVRDWTLWGTAWPLCGARSAHFVVRDWTLWGTGLATLKSHIGHFEGSYWPL